MKRSFQYRRFVALFSVSAYWLYEIIKFLLYPERRPKDLTQLFLYCMVEALLVAFAAVLLYPIVEEKAFFRTLKQQWKRKNILAGMRFALISFVVVNFLLDPLVKLFLQKLQVNHRTSVQDLHYLFHGTSAPFFWILISLFGGGFAEEVTRALSLEFFETAFGKAGLYFCLLFSSFLFGLGHWYQGASGALANFFVGLAWGILFIKRRSYATNITTHGLFDLAGALLACMLYR